jgi:hypothetical protein
MSQKKETADVQFKVCEFGDRTPYLCTLENGPRTNTVLNDTTSFTLELRDGTSFDEAWAIANYLNDHVTKIGLQFRVK